MQMYQLGYPTFSNTETDWCDTHHFSAGPVNGPKLTRELRHRMDKLVHDFNDKMRHLVKAYDKTHHEKGSEV